MGIGVGKEWNTRLINKEALRTKEQPLLRLV